MLAPTVVLACDAGYVKPTVVAARSAVANLRDVPDVIVLGSDLDDDARAELVARIDAPVTILPVPLERINALPIVQRFSPTVWALLFVGSLLPQDRDRMIWLDSDLLVRRSLDELVDVDLSGMTIAACIDYWEPTHSAAAPGFWQAAHTPPGCAYFNSGVVVIDLERWRATDVEQRLVEALAQLPAIPVPNADQDLLNATLWNEWLPVSTKWNFPAQLVTSDSYGAHVVHFFGARKPWVVPCMNAHFQREYHAAARAVGWDVPSAGMSARRLSRWMAPQGVKDMRDRRRAR